MAARGRCVGHVPRRPPGQGPDQLRSRAFAKFSAGRVSAFADSARSGEPATGRCCSRNTAMTIARKSTRRSPRGFTLIEMMLAIGVLALILVMLASSFNTIAHSKVHAEGRLMVDREGRALLWQLSQEARNAVQTPYALSDGAPIDTITMSTFSGGHRRAVAGLTPETIVTYNLVPNPNVRGWYLLERSQQSGLLTTTIKQQVTVLADNVLSLHIRYFDGNVW